ncbi:granzyme B(G,H)-like isoform X3 [Bolinopsis microptera]|uniref:granzyme B(G,H)-like isoform X3 n=1 Tax=Bolinopsis microptera TaxID=2820187 RepID=UPI00307A7CA9
MKLFLLLPHLLATLLCADKEILPRMIKLWNLPTKTANDNMPQLEKEEKIYWGKDADASIAPYQVWAGTLHVLEESDSEQHRYVDMMFPHENYNDASLSHDIALLHLKDPLILNENVSVVAIADKGAEPGDTVRVSGYGLTETGEVAVRLQYIDQDVPQRTDCLNIYGSLLDDSMWCSGDENMKHRAAQGDSGGPLVLMKDNVTELVGMVSYSITGYDKKPSYDINSDAVKMKSWANKIMNRTWVKLIATTEPQVYSWSNNGLNYQTEFIKMQCNTGKYCRVQVKSLSVNLGSSKYSRIKMFHDYDMTKEPIVELTPETYSSVQAESGFASDSDQAMLVILLGQEDMVIDLTFTYQVLDDSSCRVPSSQCNEVHDCLDLSDEIGCIYPDPPDGEMSEKAVGCYPTDYQCPNEWCIRRAHVCNGYDDCVGGADETDMECGDRGVVYSLAVVLAAAFMRLCV